MSAHQTKKSHLCEAAGKHGSQSDRPQATSDKMQKNQRQAAMGTITIAQANQRNMSVDILGSNRHEWNSR